MLFVWLVVETLGAPLPSIPILLAAGVLTATGQLSITTALALSIVACLIGDGAWYALGKRWGSSVLRVLCKISLEPDTCVRRGSDFVSRRGSRTLLFAKFVPGISTVTVILCASSGAPLLSFLFYDVLGNALYTGGYLALGRIIGARVDKLASIAHSVSGASIGIALLFAFLLIVRRYMQRRKFQASVQTSRITPQELLDLIERGANPFMVDLRHPLDMLTDARVIPGAMRLTPAQLTARPNDIPHDREIILYCT